MSQTAKAKFGTAPVFFTAISTILGAVMFLLFGFAVGNVGLAGTFAIIVIGHAVTIPTAMAIAEIATNQKVEGGGEYYIISRSFGLVIGSTVGFALYLSQAISVAFYIIAFAEAFSALFDWIQANYELAPWFSTILDAKQTVSIPALFLLTAIVLWKGADLGVKLLYAVVVTLFLSLVAFFVGTNYAPAIPGYENMLESTGNILFNTIPDTVSTIDSNGAPMEITKLSFFAVFAIIFPAFTGMTAGVGLSGDLKNPGKSIPLGTLAGTICGMIAYVFIAWKLAASAHPTALVTDTLIMSKIAWQGWILIPVGLAAATISSALGSLMVAPRTLQAIARDNLLPSETINKWVSKGAMGRDEPFNASLITIGIALIFIAIGELTFVAEIISMFFMVTYGSLCLISFLNHFAADPSYRPTFRSRWYLSLMGAIACFGLMFFMNAGYAFLAILFMIVLYNVLNYFNSDKKNLAVIFQGAIFQLSRQIHVFLQKSDKEKTLNWRPSVVCISTHSFERHAAFNMLRWLAQRYGFGTYIHQINGYLSKSTNQEAQKCQDRLIKMAETSKSNVYIDTLISPSFTSAIAQIIQLPGISGKENNLIMFEFSKTSPDNVGDILDNFNLIKAVNFDIVLLGSNQKGFGFKQEIHIWITSADYENANLMILLAYIVLGHREWNGSFIKIFAIFQEEKMKEEKEGLYGLIQTGRLPISKNNIEIIPLKPEIETKAVINEKSADADLTIIGFRSERIKKEGTHIFEGYDGIGNTLFVNANEQKAIT
ncbi:MAG: amino acid permease [Bacteroidota bacterium]